MRGAHTAPSADPTPPTAKIVPSRRLEREIARHVDHVARDRKVIASTTTMCTQVSPRRVGSRNKVRSDPRFVGQNPQVRPLCSMSRRRYVRDPINNNAETT